MNSRKKKVAAVLVIFVLAVFLWYLTGNAGKYMIRNSIRMHDISLFGEENGTVQVGTKTYRYNKEIIPILCLGIDNWGPVSIQTQGGQADAVYLAAIDPKHNDIQVIGIPRETMAEVEVKDLFGKDMGSKQLQLTLQFAYGTSGEESCDLMKSAVSKLLYNVPISGYFALNMEAINVFNDAVGGVEVTVPEDLTKFHPDLEKGRTLVLHGDQAFAFVKMRDHEESKTSYGRMERQKQYMKSFAKKAKKEIAKNPTLLLTMLDQLSDYTITDLSTEELIYLAGIGLKTDIENVEIRLLPGEIVQGERYEEFYLDEDGVKEILLDVFYEEI